MRQVGRRRLLGMAALHPPPTVGAVATVRVIAGGLHRAADQILDDPLVLPQLRQAALALRAEHLMPIILRQRNLLMMVDLAWHGTQRRFVPLLAAGPASPTLMGIGLHERRQIIRWHRRPIVCRTLTEFFHLLLQFGDTLILLLQANLPHLQLVLQSLDPRLQHLDRPRHPAALFASLRHASTLTPLLKMRAPQNHRIPAGTVNSYPTSISAKALNVRYAGKLSTVIVAYDAFAGHCEIVLCQRLIQYAQSLHDRATPVSQP